MPTHSHCPGHCSPFDFISDLWFEEVMTALGFGSRGSGKTAGVAALNALELVFKPGIDIACAGATKDQTGRGYRYVRDHLTADEFAHMLEKEPTQSSTKLKNGSFLELTTGTVKGLNSPHPIKARIDEVELIDWHVLQEGLSMSMSKPHLPYKSQDVFTSTRKSNTGTMQRLLTESEQRGIKVYSWCIWEVVEQCKRECKNDPEYGDCPIYELCQGKAHSCRGWFNIDDFIKKASLLDKETFEAQWENKRPSGGILIYSDFNEATHEIDPFPIPKDWPIVGGVDFGSNFAHTRWAIDPVTKIFFGIEEYFEDRPKILAAHSRAVKHSVFWKRSEPCFAGTRGIDKQPFIEFKNLGHRVIEAEQDILMGINSVKTVLQRRKEFVFPNGERKVIPGLVLFRGKLPITKQEFESYSWEALDDGNPDYETPQGFGDHCMSTVRYVVFTLPKRSRGYRTARVAGLG